MGDMMLNIAEDFGKYPAGRTVSDGPFSGERFLKEFLVPRLREAVSTGGKLTVSMDGLLACGSSFLDSAFGGLIREGYFQRDQVKRHLVVVATSNELERYRDAVVRYIDQAKK